MVTPRAKKASGSMLAVGPGDEDLRARFGHLQQTGQGVIQDGHPGDDQQIGLGDALRSPLRRQIVRHLPLLEGAGSCSSTWKSAPGGHQLFEHGHQGPYHHRFGVAGSIQLIEGIHAIRIS